MISTYSILLCHVISTYRSLLYHVISTYSILLCHVISTYSSLLCHVISTYSSVCHVISTYSSVCHVISTYSYVCHVISTYSYVCHVISTDSSLYHVISTLYHVIIASISYNIFTEEAGSRSKETFLGAAYIMSQFSHPNVLSLFGVCITTPPLITVLTFMNVGDLKHFLTRYTVH